MDFAERTEAAKRLQDMERAMGTESSHANQLIFLTYPGLG